RGRKRERPTSAAVPVPVVISDEEHSPIEVGVDPLESFDDDSDFEDVPEIVGRVIAPPSKRRRKVWSLSHQSAPAVGNQALLADGELQKHSHDFEVDDMKKPKEKKESWKEGLVLARKR